MARRWRVAAAAVAGLVVGAALFALGSRLIERGSPQAQAPSADATVRR
jgi:hypothetical protein